MVQEIEDQRCIDMLHGQSRGCHLEARAGVSQEQFERIRVGVTRVLARATFERQALFEKGGDMWGEWDHDIPPVATRSACSAMFRIRSGTASRYQYV